MTNDLQTFARPDFSRHVTDIAKLKAKTAAELAGRYDAEGIFQHLIGRVEEFQNNLDENEEVVLRLANYGVASEIHIRDIAFKNPNLIEFVGLDTDNSKVTLVQHISQLNFLLVASKPIDDKPFRIGFKITDDISQTTD